MPVLKARPGAGLCLEEEAAAAGLGGEDGMKEAAASGLGGEDGMKAEELSSNPNASFVPLL